MWIEVACETVRDERDRPVRAVGYYLDMTDRRNESLQNKANSEALRQLREQSFQLLKMAKTDALTGLHNRQAAIPKIEERLRAVEAGELGDASCALIMLDLDSFKLANDVFGHAYGDQVIVHVAEALKESFPATSSAVWVGTSSWCGARTWTRERWRIGSPLRCVPWRSNALRTSNVPVLSVGRLRAGSAGGLLVRRPVSESGFGVVLGQDGRQALLLAILVWDEERCCELAE